MLGTRGVPAAYGGFETAVEEIGRRLVERGHTVVVYSRDERGLQEHLGMHRVWLPSLRRKQLETLSHSALSVLHASARNAPDVAFVFNAANSPFLPVLRARRVPTALHMDGLEWQRAKWGRAGRSYYRWAEQHGVRWADRLIADAPGIADYYTDEFGVPTELLRYGAPILGDLPATGVEELGLEPGGYHLVVARFEPENHVLEIVSGYRRSAASLPLVVVGGAPYAEGYTAKIHDAAAGDDRVRMLGPVYDQDLLDALYLHAATYLHGHSVGGTNPSLLRAMGAGTAVIAHDNVFNREILGREGWYFGDDGQVALAVERAEVDGAERSRRSAAVLTRASEEFTWESVTDGYERLAVDLASAGVGPRRRRARRRDGRPAWS
ncbi:DUF1972 domain-containing protein [Nocardioides marmoraquaticus]